MPIASLCGLDSWADRQMDVLAVDVVWCLSLVTSKGRAGKGRQGKGASGKVRERIGREGRDGKGN